MSSFAGCSCPAPSALTAIPDSGCGEKIGQIGMIAFQRKGYTWGTALNTTIADEAQWDTLVTATNDTKIVLTGKLEKVTMTAGESSVDNDANNFDGAEYITSFGATVLEGYVRNPSAAKMSALFKLNCEQGLVAYLFQSPSEGRNIIHVLEGTAVRGIPVIGSVSVSEVNHQGKGASDEAKIRVNLAYGWTAARKFTQPGFDPYTAI